jgi:hypothetical protein
MGKTKAHKRRAAQPLPMLAAPAKTVCCEEKYGITVSSKSRRCRRCPKLWKQR